MRHVEELEIANDCNSKAYRAALHQRMLGYARHRAAFDADELQGLFEVQRVRLWRDYGCASALEYLERVLGYAPHTASERLRVAQELQKLPKLREALHEGRVSFSAVRELSRVATPETEDAWLAAASGKIVRQIEDLVAHHHKGELPTDEPDPTPKRCRLVYDELAPETFAAMRQLRTRLEEEMGGKRLENDVFLQVVSRRVLESIALERSPAARVASGHEGESLEAPAVHESHADRRRSLVHEGPCVEAPSVHEYVEDPSVHEGEFLEAPPLRATALARADGALTVPEPLRKQVEAAPVAVREIPTPRSLVTPPAYQIAFTRCLHCDRTTQNGGGVELLVDPHVLDRAECDAVFIGDLGALSPERATQSVTPRKRRQVFARDHYRCCVPGCRSTKGLDVHHIEFQSEGGSHELHNLCLLCSGHHAQLHEGNLRLTGTAPDALCFEWKRGMWWVQDAGSR